MRRFNRNFVEPCSHTSHISASRGLLLQHISEGHRVDWCRIAFGQIARFKPVGFPRSAVLPYGVILSTLLITQVNVPLFPGEPREYSTDIHGPLNAHSRALSTAHVDDITDDEDGVSDDEGVDTEGETAAPRGRPPRANSLANLASQFADVHADIWRLEQSLNEQISCIERMGARQAQLDVTVGEISFRLSTVESLLIAIRDEHQRQGTQLLDWHASQMLQVGSLANFMQTVQRFIDKFPGMAPSPPPPQ